MAATDAAETPCKESTALAADVKAAGQELEQLVAADGSRAASGEVCSAAAAVAQLEATAGSRDKALKEAALEADAATDRGETRREECKSQYVLWIFAFLKS